MIGCADGQEAVAGFVTALRDIDGVTRVGDAVLETPRQRRRRRRSRDRLGRVDRRRRSCQTEDFVAQFQIVAAFDAAPVPATASRKANEMKVTASHGTIVAILVVVALAIVFWVLLLSPKREEARNWAPKSKACRRRSPSRSRKSPTAEAARRDFPKNYRQLVVLGQAVPAGDETASLLVELNRIAKRPEVDFESISAGDGRRLSRDRRSGSCDGTDRRRPPPRATPTEAEAALLPIGASDRRGRPRDHALRPRLRTAASSTSPTSSRGSTPCSTPRTARSRSTAAWSPSTASR